MIGFVVRRLRARLALAAAALLTVLIATAVLTALVAFDGVVGDAGVQRALQGAGRLRASVLVDGDNGADVRAKQDAEVGQFAADLFGSRAAAVQSLAVSGPFGLSNAGPGTTPDLTVFGSIDRGRVQLLGGRWPQPSATAGQAGAPIEVAVPEAEQKRLGLDPSALPARLELADRMKGGTRAVLVTGFYAPADLADPYWTLDELGGRGTRTQVSTTYGPMLVDDSAFTSGALAQGGRKWLLTGDFHGFTGAGLADLKDRATSLPDEFRATSGLTVATQLGDFIGELQLDELVARSTLTLGALQLAVLAAAALLLTVNLLTDRQQAENELLTARGASRRRLGALTAAEAVLIALPAAVLAPPLTPLLLRLLAGWGPLAKFRLAGGLPWIAWPVAAGCALACVLIATLPTAFRAVGAATLRRAGRRQALVAGTVRSGGDVALLVLAVVAYQQLSHYAAGGLTADSSGQLGVDPLLVLAPTLALCAGTVLVLRLLPLAARVGERLAGRRADLAPALVGWQLARRPRRGSGPVLLLVLAVSIGVLALGQRSAWSRSQVDQADFGTAGGLRISDSTVELLGQGGLYSSLPGGERVIPVARMQQPLTVGSATVLAVDAAAAARELRIRPDLLGGRTVQQLLQPLVPEAATGPMAGIPLPGRPRRIDLDLDNHVTGIMPAAVGPQPPRSALATRPYLQLVLADRFGVTSRALVPAVPEEGRATVSVDLSGFLGRLGSAAAPLRIVGIAASVDLTENVGYTGVLTIDRIAAADTPDGPATTAAVPSGLGWSAATRSGVGGRSEGTTDATADGGHPLVLGYKTDPQSADGSLRVDLTAADSLKHTAPVPQLNAVVTRSYLDAVGAKVGDSTTLPIGTAQVEVKITAAVDALPTTDGPAVLVDFDGLNRDLVGSASAPRPPAEWWLPAAGPGDPNPAKAAAALRASTAHQSLHLRDEVAAALRGDPVSAAPQNALAALAVAAAVLAAVGFAAATAGAAAERLGEFSVLMALGASRRTLGRTVAAEQGVLVALGIGVGVGLGTLLAHLVVPVIVLTAAGRPPIPAVTVQLPLGQVALLAAAIAVAVLVPALLQGRRRRDLTARLRHVEEM